MITIDPMPPLMDMALQKKILQTDVATFGHGDGLRFAHRSIQGLDTHKTIAGRAITIRLVKRDSGLLHHAIGLCRAGDVLVIRAGDNVHACLGGGVGFAAKTQGIIGAVIDGPATDRLELQQHDFPVWCKGISPVTTQAHGEQGKMNTPTEVGDVWVRPGDIVFADSNGVVFLSPEECQKHIDWAIEKIAKGEKNRQAVKKGAKFGDRTGASARVLKNLKS